MRRGVLLLVLLLFLVGCGGSADDGPTRYHVDGEVKFDGKPIPIGTISFETSAGPAGTAQIVEGKFDTRKGKGIVGGKHSVVIQGYDGAGANPGEMGKPIFNPYRVEEDFPQSDTTKNFEVPASAAKDLVISNDPA